MSLLDTIIWAPAVMILVGGLLMVGFWLINYSYQNHIKKCKLRITDQVHPPGKKPKKES
jgi:hypothetical protein